MVESPGRGPVVEPSSVRKFNNRGSARQVGDLLWTQIQGIPNSMGGVAVVQPKSRYSRRVNCEAKCIGRQRVSHGGVIGFAPICWHESPATGTRHKARTVVLCRQQKGESRRRFQHQGSLLVSRGESESQGMVLRVTVLPVRPGRQSTTESGFQRN